MAVKKSGLGKGLDALFADNTADLATRSLRVSEIEPNRSQPRKHFDEAALAELADSIKQYGVIQPIAVRPLPGSGYQIVAGERRWRASRMAGITEVPVVVLDITDSQAMEIALVENLQREDLNPIEEAEGYRVLAEEYALTQDQIANRVGRSRPAVANAMRLLSLPEAVREKVKGGQLSAGHARALLAADPARQENLAQEVMKKGLTVRETEKLAAKKSVSSPPPIPPKDAFYREMELALTERLGCPVSIQGGRGKGTLSLTFYSQEELKELAKLLAGDL